MAYFCGRYVVVFNGEIYNHDALHRELSPHAWRGHSDTEVMMDAFSRWGIAEALTRFIDMFALAACDRRERKLVLARDRPGGKPLHYCLHAGAWRVASALKALRADPALPVRIDRNVFAAYLRFGCVPAPLSIYKGVFKLPPGMLLEIHLTSGAEPSPQPHWSPGEAAQRAKATQFTGGDDEAVTELDPLLRDTVSRQCVTDGSLGAFLSGGVDSSLVVALMQTQSVQPIRTFTIGFRKWGYDEAPHAAAVAKHLGTSHTGFVWMRQRLAASYSSCRIFMTSRLPILCRPRPAWSPGWRAADMIAALPGDGGDEMFGGYNRCVWAMHMQTANRMLPSALARLAARSIQGISPARGGAMFRCLPLRHPPPRSGRQAAQVHARLGCRIARISVLEPGVSVAEDPALLVLGGTAPVFWVLPCGSGSTVEQMQVAGRYSGHSRSSHHGGQP